MNSFFKGLLYVGIISGVIYWMYGCQASDIRPLKHSWETAVPFQAPPEGLSSILAKDCGVCHPNHYKEWKVSTHAHAWTDVQFQAEIKKESSPYMCINCHIPLVNQQEFLVKGLIAGDIYQPVKEVNPNFSKELQQEGINCATCHVREGAIIGSIGVKNAPHKVVKDPDFLSEKLCISCHNAVEKISDELVCTFETGDEWKAGPFHGKKNCINCHMDTSSQEMVKGFGVKKTHLHSFPGSGIPKHASETAPMLLGYSFKPSTLKKDYTIGDTIQFEFEVFNKYAGHKVPTGDPERFFLFNFKWLDENQKIVFETKERIGEKWEWYPVAKKLEDNNLLPGEKRLMHSNFPLQQKGLFTLVATVTKYRMTAEAVKYNKLGREYPTSIQVYEKSFDFLVK